MAILRSLHLWAFLGSSILFCVRVISLGQVMSRALLPTLPAVTSSCDCGRSSGNNNTNAQRKESSTLVDASDHSIQKPLLSTSSTNATAASATNAYAFLYYSPENSHQRDTVEGCEVLVALNALKTARGDRGPKDDSSVDFVVMELPGNQMSEVVRSGIINDIGGTIVPIDPPKSKGSGKQPWIRRYIESFAKLRAAQLFAYDRVIFLELDYLPLQSLDHLFDAFGGPAVTKVPYAAPYMYWEGKRSFSQAGPFVVDPDPVFWQRYFQNTLDGGDSNGNFAGDNDWTNAKFSGTEPMLPGFMAALIGEFIPGDRIYGYWGKYYKKSSEEIYLSAPGIHFVAGWKPWGVSPSDISKYSNDKGYQQLQAIYNRWWSIRDNICPLKQSMVPRNKKKVNFIEPNDVGKARKDNGNHLQGNAESSCIMWRQTSGCSPNGAREPEHDMSCAIRIQSGSSGYCECKGGRRAGESGCNHKALTCNDACRGLERFDAAFAKANGGKR